MSEFDATDYFNRVSAANLAANASGETQDKFSSVIDAKRRAVTALNRKADVIAARRQLQENSIVGKLGMDVNSLAGTVANIALATGEELLPSTLHQPGAIAPRDDTGEVQSGLFRRLGDVGVATAQGVVGLGDAIIGIGDLATGGLVGKGWDELGRDSKATHRFLNDLYSPEQRLANQNVEDAKGFLGTVEAMLDNPTTIAKGLIESLPSMIAGGKIGREVLALFPKVAALVGGTASLTTGVAGAIGEGTIMAGSQAEAIRQETADGRLSFKQSLLAAGTGVMGAAVARVGAGAAKRLGVGDIDEALVAGALAPTKRGYTTSIGLSAAIEAGEETIQSMGETALKNIALDKPWDEGIGEAAAKGMLTAAPLGAYSGLGKRVMAAVEEQQTEQTRQEVQNAAVATGDVTALVDPKSPTFAPSKAIAALSGHSSLPGTTPEAKEANLAKAGEIVATLQTARDEAQAVYDSVSPEGLKKLEATNKNLLAQIAVETDPARAKALQTAVDGNLETLAAPATPAKEVAALKLVLTTAERHLTEATDGLSRFNEDQAASSKVDVAAEVAIINTKITEDDAVAVSARSAAATRVINLSMAIPERLSTAVAESLVADQANGLTDPQRIYLRALVATRVATDELKSMGDVAQDIYTGSKGNVGIAQYRERVMSAIAAGSLKLADGTLQLMARFADDHQGKADMAEKALEMHQQTGKPVQAVRNGAIKEWEINTGTLLSKREAAVNGAITIHRNTPTTLVPTLRAEANAINAAMAEIGAAFELKFPGEVAHKPPQGAPNVQVVPKPSAPAPSQPVVQQTTPAVESTATVPGSAVVPAAVAGAPTTSVEAAGVKLTGTGNYVAKDQLKADTANKFIGQGSAASSTAQYAQDFGAAANTGEYLATDRVFVSAEGNRRGRLDPNFDELGKATTAGATIITDNAVDRDRSYNVGERQVARFLIKTGYVETKPGEWTQASATPATPATQVDSKAAPAAVVTTTQQVTEQVADEATVLNQSKSDSTEAPESQGETSEEASANAGALSVMADVPEKGTAYEHQNLIASGFTQSEAREGDATKRPLVAVKDFLSTGWGSVMNFLTTKTLSEDGVQLETLKSFRNTATEWAKTIRANLPKVEETVWFRYPDSMQFLLTKGTDGAPDVDENVKTAISAVIYAWAADKATSTRQATNESINAILGRDKKDYVTPFGREQLGAAGEYQHMLVDTLGSEVYALLGFKPNEDAGQERESRLKSALGLHALKLMEDMGLVTRTTISGSVIAQLRYELLTDQQIDRLVKKSGPINPHAPHYFFAVARQEDGPDKGRVVEAVQKIYEANKGSKSILDKLFGTAAKNSLPSLAPVTKVQATTSGTGQAVPKSLSETQRIKQSRPWVVQKDMLGLMGIFDTAQLNSLIGMKELSEKATHLVNVPGLEAKNDGLRREWDLFSEYVGENLATAEKGLDTPMFMTFDVWKQQRVGNASNVVNPQTSKIVRQLIVSPEWTTAIDPNAPGGEGARLMTSYYLRVAEGLKIKTERADNEASIEKVKGMLAQPVFADAVAALTKSVIHKKELTAEETAAIVAGVAAGKTNLHSLSALLAVAQQTSAIVNGVQQSFTVQLMGEVDGVANGTMLNHVLMGAGSPGMLNRGGFFEVGHGHTQYNQWRGEPGNLDIYEHTARKIHAYVTEMVVGPNAGPNAQKVLTSIWAIGGELFLDDAVTSEGRDLVKEALNPVAFGSALLNMIEGMSRKFVGSVYAGLEKLSVDGAPQSEVDAFVGHINQLIQSDKDKLSTGESIQWYMNAILTKKAASDITAAFQVTVGRATGVVVEQEFSTYLTRRDQLNNTAQLTYGLYEAIHDGVREAYVEELLAKGELDKVPGGRLADLSKKQEKELNKRLRQVEPVMQTSASKKDGPEANSGIRLAKSKRSQSKDKAHESKVKFSTPIKSTGHRSTGVSGIVTVSSSPGVIAGSASTHALDSDALADVEAKRAILGIHDAAGDGVGGLEETARQMNASIWNKLLNYSPLEEAYQALASTLGGIAAMQKEGTLPPQAIKRLQAYLLGNAWKAGKGTDPKDFLSIMLADAKLNAYVADGDKFDLMKTWASVDQYAFQGGNHEVTDSDRAEAAKKQEALQVDLSAKANTVLKDINDFVWSKPVETVATPVAEVPVVAEVAEVEEAPPGADSYNDQDAPWDFDVPGDNEETVPAKKSSLFGEVGTPAKTSQPLASFFEGKQEVSAAEVLKQLYGMMGSSSQFSRLLVGMLRKAMPSDIKVIIVTPDTVLPESKLPEPENRGRSFGWKSGNEIYILGNGFVNSGLQTTEVLLHELVHGALQHIIGSPQGVEVALIADLKNLMSQVSAYAKKNGVTGFDAALNDVDEFVAYGMTHKPFQELLAKVSVTRTTDLVNGFKEFVDKLVGLLFARIKTTRTQDEQAKTALAALIDNVTGLLESGTKEQATARAAGSTGKAKSMTVPNTNADPYTTLDIHNSLNAGAVTPAFDQKLRDLLSGIVLKLHGPFGAFKAAIVKDQTLTPGEVWLKALGSGVAPFNSSMQASPLKSSDQEDHAMEQVEATVRAALERSEVTMTSAYRELNKLYDEAAKIIKPSDFATQDEYDFLFKIAPGATGKSDHLARFAAYGLAHQQVNTLLRKDTNTPRGQVAAQKTFIKKLEAFWAGLLEFFHEKISGTYAGQKADAKLTRLVEQLVDIEAKHTVTMELQANAKNWMAPVERKTKQALDFGIKKVVDAAGSKFVRNSNRALVRAAGLTARALASGHVDKIVEGFAQMRDRHHKERLGIIAGTINFATNGSKVYEELTRARKLQEGERKDIITNTGKVVLSAFVNQGVGMARAASESITQVFLRTGMHVLSDQFNLVEMENLLGSKQAVMKEIDALEAQLTTAMVGPLKNYMLDQANALGYFAVTDRAKVPKMLLNAGNIARMYGTPYRGRLSEAQSQQAEAVLEKLVALYALSYMDSASLNQAKEVLRTENARTDGGGNGVELVLALHKNLDQQAKDRIFKGEAALMGHGHTPDIYSPHVDILTANDADGAALMRQGYTKGAEVEIDPAHPNQSKKHLYSRKGGGLMPYLSGSVSNSGKNAAGSKQHGNYMNVNTADGLANASLHADIMHAKKGPLYSGPRRDFSKGGRTFMVPVMNPQGDIVNWRYMMQATTKDSILKRENRVDKVLGTLAGSIYDKETALEVNIRIFQALKDQWEAEKGKHPESYVAIGPKSTDKEAQGIWSMLSEDSKAEARKIWGKDGMFVRRDTQDIVFGYRKQSIADAIKNTQKRRAEAAEREAKGLVAPVSQGIDDDAEKLVSKIFTLFVERVLTLYASSKGFDEPEKYGERAAWIVAQGEGMWRELVAETKDILVIKSVAVMLGNIKSNVSFHLLSGVPIKDIWHGYVVAYRGATTYQRDSDELARLQTLLDIKQTNGKEAEIRRKVAKLTNEIARNPVKGLIDAGLMPTIVEDAANDEDPYSYKSALTEKLDAFSTKVHPSVKSAAKLIYMAKDTKPYQVLRHITQLSDFMARYVQYQHVTKRKENPLSHEDAIQQSSEDFINYEIPMQRTMQYLDDMGIMPFMKYFLRIQKVLVRLHHEHPARTLVAMLLGNFMNLGPIVLDSSLLHKLGNNPLNFGGPMQFLSVLDELPAVNAAMSLVSSGSAVPEAVLAAQ